MTAVIEKNSHCSSLTLMPSIEASIRLPDLRHSSDDLIQMLQQPATSLTFRPSGPKCFNPPSATKYTSYIHISNLPFDAYLHFRRFHIRDQRTPTKNKTRSQTTAQPHPVQRCSPVFSHSCAPIATPPSPQGHTSIFKNLKIQEFQSAGRQKETWNQYIKGAQPIISKPHPPHESSLTQVIPFTSVILFQKKTSMRFLHILSLLLLAAISNVQAQTYPNPGECSGFCSYVHDPYVIQRVSDGTYFRFATFNEIMIATAPNLTGPWTEQGAALPGGSDIGIPGNMDLWVGDFVNSTLLAPSFPRLHYLLPHITI